MKVGFFPSKMFHTSTIEAISEKAGFARAGEVLFCAEASRILVAGESKRGQAHVWESTQRSKTEE